MIYKYDLSISGDAFYPEKIIGNIRGNLNVESPLWFKCSKRDT